MTYSAPVPAIDQTVELSQAAHLPALKLQMEGLFALFGSAVHQKPAIDPMQDDVAEQAFDNVPV